MQVWVLTYPLHLFSALHIFHNNCSFHIGFLNPVLAARFLSNPAQMSSLTELSWGFIRTKKITFHYSYKNKGMKNTSLTTGLLSSISYYISALARLLQTQQNWTPSILTCTSPCTILYIVWSDEKTQGKHRDPIG